MEDAVKPGQPNEWLNAALVEVRVAGNFTEPGPWDVALLFVLAADANVEQCERAIAEVLAESGLLEPPANSCVKLESWTAGSMKSISVWDYAGSYLMSLDEISYQGDIQVFPDALRAEPA
jgi:hypothetical protein